MDELLELLKTARDDVTIHFSFVVPWEAKEKAATEDSGREENPNGEPRHILAFHASAHENFNAKALELLTQLSSSSFFLEQPSAADSAEDGPIIHHVPSSAERYPIDVFRDGAGAVVARSFVHEGIISGLQADAYRNLRRLAEGIQRTSNFRKMASIATVEKLLFEWIREQVLGSTAATATQYLIDRVEASVRTFRVIVPFFKVIVPESIQIGQVTIRTLRSDEFQEWERFAIGKNPSVEHVLKVREIFFRERNQLQGFAAAEVTLTGEKARVLEIAIGEAEQAVSLLRLFTPAIISPQGRSFCALFGREQAGSTSTIILSNAGVNGISLGKTSDTETDVIWEIERDTLKLIRESALNRLAENLLDESASEFAHEVRAALYLYSQSALKSAPTDKLITIIIPLESLLLRSSSEPIGENISYRLAHSIGLTPEERKRILETTRKAYGLRSGYVHHLKPVETDKDLDTLRSFMEYAWQFFMKIGTTVNRYKDRTEFLSMLDDRKL
jgi:hypothetical protein